MDRLQRQWFAKYFDDLIANNHKEKWNKNVKENEKIFNKGVEKLEDELDWVKILTAIRQVNTLVKVVLNDQQIFLQNFLKNNLIENEELSLSLLSNYFPITVTIELKYKNYQIRGTVWTEEAEYDDLKNQLQVVLDDIIENGQTSIDEKLIKCII